MEVTDSAPGALPGLSAAPAREFLTAVGAEPAAKLGWTDVARFAALGIPALNYGPGDPAAGPRPGRARRDRQDPGRRGHAAPVADLVRLGGQAGVGTRPMAGGYLHRGLRVEGGSGAGAVAGRGPSGVPRPPAGCAAACGAASSCARNGSSRWLLCPDARPEAGRRACAVRVGNCTDAPELPSVASIWQKGRGVAILFPKPNRLFTGYGPSALPWLP